MQNDRREFVKKSAMVVGAGAVVGTTTLVASGNGSKADSNGVVVGKSPKKEILYKRSQAWEDFYNLAK